MRSAAGRGQRYVGQVKGNTPEDRVKTWFNHLLGDPPTVTAKIWPSQTLTSMTAPSRCKSYGKSSALSSAGPDDIPLELLNNCKLDEYGTEDEQQAHPVVPVQHHPRLKFCKTTTCWWY